jgi:hypothetical protein
MMVFSFTNLELGNYLVLPKLDYPAIVWYILNLSIPKEGILNGENKEC